MLILKEVLQKSQDQGVAVGHFNVSDMLLLKAVSTAARHLNVPVIVGASEGERSYFGAAQLASLVKSLREQHGSALFLNADHTHSLPSAIEAAKLGFDSIVFDRSSLPFEENIRQTKEAVEALKSINPDIVVEGEIGDIGSGSEVHATHAHLGPLTTPQEAIDFVSETKVDVLAPAVGNMHGLVRTMVEGTEKKRLNIGRIKEIKDSTNVFLTLHGGSGTDDEDLRRAIAAGVNIVHVNTEVRIAWRQGFEAAFAKHPDEVVPYNLLPSVEESVMKVVANRLRVFNRL